MGRLDCTIYVGDLPMGFREREVEELFDKYGHILDIDLKRSAFVVFDDSRDADNAIRARDGCRIDGHRLCVKHARGRRGSSRDRYSSYNSGGSRNRVSRRSNYRVLVTGLPDSASWQDLKDHMRCAGHVCHSKVFRVRDGTRGVVVYTNYDDMKNAIRLLDSSLFENRHSHAYIRVEECDRGRNISRTPSYSQRGSRSRSRGHSNGIRSRRAKHYQRSPSRSLSKSISSKARSESPTHSTSRSPTRVRSPVSPLCCEHLSRSPDPRSRSRNRSRGAGCSQSPRPSSVRSD